MIPSYPYDEDDDRENPWPAGAFGAGLFENWDEEGNKRVSKTTVAVLTLILLLLLSVIAGSGYVLLYLLRFVTNAAETFEISWLTSYLWHLVIAFAIVGVLVAAWRYRRKRRRASQSSRRSFIGSLAIVRHWPGLTGPAYAWLIAFAGVLIAAYISAARNPAGWQIGSWSARSVITTSVLFLPIVTAFAMHYTDTLVRNKGHRGFRNRYRESGSYAGDDATSGVFTVLSIRVAITLGVLNALLQHHWRYLTLDTSASSAELLDSVMDQPVRFVYFLIVSSLALSLLMSLAALICHEYSVRFSWSGAVGDDTRRSLRIKSFDFSTASFYTLTWSLLAITALIDYRVVFAAIVFVYLVLWTYYYFPVGPAEAHSRSSSHPYYVKPSTPKAGT